jgi:ankyrin repeat protein
MKKQSKIEKVIESIVAGASITQIVIECNDIELDHVDIHGRTPLMVAAAHGSLAAVEALVRCGASVHASGVRQMTALHEASANGKTKITEYLLSLGARVYAVTTDGVTPLMCAAAWGNIEVTALLLESGADLTRTDRTGATASDIAREKGEGDAADLIDSYAQSRN